MAGPFKIGSGIAYICSHDDIFDFAGLAKLQREKERCEIAAMETQHEQAVKILSLEIKEDYNG